MLIARIPVREDNSIGDKLGEWITLRGEKYSNDLAGEQYSVGKEVLCWDVGGNFAGDTVVMLEVLLDSAGDKKDFAKDDLSVAFGWG